MLYFIATKKFPSIEKRRFPSRSKYSCSTNVGTPKKACSGISGIESMRSPYTPALCRLATEFTTF